MALSTVAKHGTLDVPMPPGPEMFAYADEDLVHRDLDEIGYVDVVVRPLRMLGRNDDPDFLVNALQYSTVRTKITLDAQTPEALEAIFDDLKQQTEALKTPEGDYAMAFHSTCVSGRKP